MFKRVLATALTILMLLSVIPATVVSAASNLPYVTVQPTHYMDDNNGVRWYYFGVENAWKFGYGLYSYSADMSIYLQHKALVAPTVGTIYVFSTDTEYALCRYNEITGWEIYAYAGAQGGQGGLGGVTMSDYTLQDDHGAIWKNQGGVWKYVKSPWMGTVGTMTEYLATYKTLPTSGTVRTADGTVYCYANFDSTTQVWSLTWSGMGGTLANYTIFDNNKATWTFYANTWYFTGTLANGQQVYGDLEDYVVAYGGHPSTGTATDAKGQFITYCDFDTTNLTWVQSTGGGLGSGTLAFDYIVDNNNIKWVMRANAWYYVTPNSTYGTVADYISAYNKYPVSGTAYNAQNAPVVECTFSFQTYSWTVKSSTATPDVSLTGTYYLLDNNNVIWYYYNSTWCIQTTLTANGYGTINEYVLMYSTTPMSATLFTANGVSMGVYVFDQLTSSWQPVGDAVVPDVNNPGTGTGTGTGTSDGYYSGMLSDPNLGQKVYDTKGRLWTKSGVTWTCPYSNQYTVQNPARYIDSSNRVWEMRNSRWVLNEYADPGEDAITKPVAVDPNNLPTLTDTKGYTWTKSGYYWTSTASSYYNVMGVTPEYKANDSSVWTLNSTRTTWTKKSAGTGTGTGTGTTTPSIPDSVAGYTTYVFDGKTYLVPNHTVEVIPGPTTLPYKPDGYSWITYNGKYSLMNLNTGDVYPLPTLYQLPSGYYYYPTGDANNPWRIVGNGSFVNSTITSLELVDYPWKLEVGKTYQCKADFESADREGLSTLLIWSSSNTDVAIVDQTGKVTIVGVGRADIKVRTFLGFLETSIDIYGIAPEVEDKPSTPVTPPVEPDEPDVPVEPEVPTTPVSDIFSDVSANAPYAEYIQYVYDNNIFRGMTDPVKDANGNIVTKATFAPEGTMTRAQFYTVLARMAGYTDDAELKAKYPTSTFSDCKDKWFTAAVAWAYAEGLDGGVGAMQIKDASGELVWVENCFNPDGAIKREDACAALYKFAQKYHRVYFDQPYNIAFNDADAVNWWAQPAVSSFSQLGILSGHIIDNGNNFRPEDPATRSDIATIIARYAELYMK